MVVSNTNTFNLDIPELVEEAFERAGLRLSSGYDMATARRSLNLMMTDWANRGINMWTVEQRTLTLVAGTATYTLGTDIVDLMEHVIRLPNTSSSTSNQTDYMITRSSVSTYATRTNKLVEARPTEIYIDRQRDAPQITLWPVPDDAGYELIYWVLRRIYDVGDYSNNMDVPFRFLEPLVAGLAFNMALKRPEVADRVDGLETRYEQAFRRAASEDREKADLRLVPHRNYRR